jgi:hypothetical protein
MLTNLKLGLRAMMWRDWIILLIFGMQVVTLSVALEARDRADSAAYAGWEASSEVDRVAGACEKANEAAGEASEYAEEARDQARQAVYQCGER